MSLAWEPKQLRVPLRDLVFMVFISTAGAAVFCGACREAWRGLLKVIG